MGSNSILLRPIVCRRPQTRLQDERHHFRFEPLSCLQDDLKGQGYCQKIFQPLPEFDLSNFYLFRQNLVTWLYFRDQLRGLEQNACLQVVRCKEPFHYFPLVLFMTLDIVVT